MPTPGSLEAYTEWELTGQNVQIVIVLMENRAVPQPPFDEEFKYRI